MLFVAEMGRRDGLIATAATIVAAGLLGAGCHDDRATCIGDGCVWSSAAWARVQSISNLPSIPPQDLSNSYSLNSDAAALGRLFYFDPRFSGSAPAVLVDSIGRPVAAARVPKGEPTNLSCATCHDPTHAGTDDTSVPNTVSIGAGIYDVNGQQTVNAAFYPLLYWNGRSDSLWSQAMAVNESGFSMNGTRLHTFWTILDYYLAPYQNLFRGSRYPLPAIITDAQYQKTGKPVALTPTCPKDSAYFDCTLGMPAQNVVNQVFVNFGKAIAAYEERLVSANSPFDKFVLAGPGSGRISAAAERGALLFVGKASCTDCHNTPLLSDGKFHNIGVPQSGEHVPTIADCPPTHADGGCVCVPNNEGTSCEPAGAWVGAKKIAGTAGTSEELSAHFQNDFLRTSRWSDQIGAREPVATTQIGVPADAGSIAPLDPSLKGAWRTPSLRDVALTAPYMHDGYYQTLTEVVQHYNMGGVPGAGTTFDLPVCGTADAGTVCMNADAGQSVPHLAAQIKPLGLSDDEISDLVAFLETLTGQALPPEVIDRPTLPDASAEIDGTVLVPGGATVDAGQPIQDAGSAP